MRLPSILPILNRYYCPLVFSLAFALSFLLIPKAVFAGVGIPVALSFMLVFALSATCFIRNVKDKVASGLKQNISLFNIILGIIGITAFQFCSLGAHVCGASLLGGIITLLFPGFLINFLSNFGLKIIIFSIIAQSAVLLYSRCFKMPAKT